MIDETYEIGRLLCVFSRQCYIAEVPTRDRLSLRVRGDSRKSSLLLPLVVSSRRQVLLRLLLLLLSRSVALVVVDAVAIGVPAHVPPVVHARLGVPDAFQAHERLGADDVVQPQLVHLRGSGLVEGDGHAVAVQHLQLLSGDGTENLRHVVHGETTGAGVLALEPQERRAGLGRGGDGDVLPLERRVHGGLVHVLQAEKLGAQVDLAGVSLLGRLLDFERVQRHGARDPTSPVLGGRGSRRLGFRGGFRGGRRGSLRVFFLHLSLGDAVAVLPRVEKRSAAFDVPAGGIAGAAGCDPRFRHRAGHRDVYQELRGVEKFVHGFHVPSVEVLHGQVFNLRESHSGGKLFVQLRAHFFRVHLLGQHDLHHLRLAGRAQRQRHGRGDARPRAVRRPSHGHRQRRAPGGAFQETQRVEMSDEALLAVLREPEPQPLRAPAVGGVVSLEHGQGRHLRDDVFPELVPAHAALRADPAVRAVGDGDPLQRLLQIRLEPPLGDPGIDVVPRQRRVETLVRERSAVDASLASSSLCAVVFVPELLQHVPLAVHDLPVLPVQARLGDGAVEGAERRVLTVPPRVLVRAELPGPADHRAQRPVASADEIFHGADADGRPVALHVSHFLQRGFQQRASPLKLVRGDAVPLERRVRLRREIGQRQRQRQLVALARDVPGDGLDEPLNGLGDSEDVRVRLTRQADHEIQLHVSPTPVVRRLHAVQQLVVRQALVDDVPKALRPRLGGKRQASLPGAAEDVRHGVVEAVDALRRQRQGDVLVLQPVLDLQPDAGEREVIRARQRQQRELVVPRVSHPALHGFHHHLRVDVPRRPGEHTRLAEAAPACAASADLHGQAVVHRADVRHEPDLHQRVGVGDAAADAFRDALANREHGAPPSRRRVVKPRDVNPHHLRREPKQRLLSVQLFSLALLQAFADLGHDVLAVADAHEIAKVSHRFGIGRRRRPADEHQRPRSVVHVPNLVRFVIALFPRQRHAAQVQHLQDVHRAQLVRQR
mmetsp:Transcript_13186/g.55388  ORF Transcript_13186/g.55388 Transcript_13186/m.55388 type:complete len:998 (-) Transcript_13186:627-3620(-)